ncbi:hypothetical protein [Lactobacillus sp.]|uniref:hypothetical protein n=1 Tax=Lactobacillus sp. TaxID=1591 RepID=UPI0025C3DD90|nr:hypothetical protein [Lactobacillus sp.]
MKLRKTVISLVSFLSVGAMFSTFTSTVNADSTDWYYPALGKAEDMPTKPESSQTSETKKSVKQTKVSKKRAKKSSKKHTKKSSKKHVTNTAK